MRHQRVFEAGITASDKTMTFQRDAHVSAPTSFAFIEEYDGHLPGSDDVFALHWRISPASGEDYVSNLKDLPVLIRADGMSLKVYRYSSDVCYPMLYIVKSEDDEHSGDKAYSLYAVRVSSQSQLEAYTTYWASVYFSAASSSDAELQQIYDDARIYMAKICEFDTLEENPYSIPITTHRAVADAIEQAFYGDMYIKYSDSVQICDTYAGNYHSLVAQGLQQLYASKAYSMTCNFIGRNESDEVQEFSKTMSCTWCGFPLLKTGNMTADTALINTLVTFDHFTAPATDLSSSRAIRSLCEGDIYHAEILVPRWQIRVKNTDAITEVYAIRSHMANIRATLERPEEDIDYSLGNIIGMASTGANGIPVMKAEYSGHLKFGRMKTQVYKVTF